MATTFREMHGEYQYKYVRKHGSEKLLKVREKVLGSTAVQNLSKTSIQQKTDPSQADFGAAIHSMAYFVFASRETCAMAEFIATLNWDETVNSYYRFCSEQSMYVKGKAILNRWGQTI